MTVDVNVPVPFYLDISYNELMIQRIAYCQQNRYVRFAIYTD